MMQAYGEYMQAMMQAGALVEANWLQPTSSATTVSVREGKMITTHGPFAETKEQLGGYFVLECENLDDALAWAAQCPSAHYGRVEVRPILPPVM